MSARTFEEAQAVAISTPWLQGRRRAARYWNDLSKIEYDGMLGPRLSAVHIHLQKGESTLRYTEETSRSASSPVDFDMHVVTHQPGRFHYGGIGWNLEVREETRSGELDVPDSSARVLVTKYRVGWVCTAQEATCQRIYDRPQLGRDGFTAQCARILTHLVYVAVWR
jgi:hypothetical protein